MNADPILTLALDRVELYQFWQFFWFTVHYGAGLIAILAGGLATASAAKEGPSFLTKYVWVWGLVASLLSGVVTFLGPLQKAQSYKQAYYKLEPAASSYKAGTITIEKLEDAIEISQKIVLVGYSEQPQSSDNHPSADS